MRVIHVLTPGLFPLPGGLEASVLRIAHNLAEAGRSRVIIYTRRQPASFRLPHPAHGELEVVHLGQDKEFLMAPLGVAGRQTETVPGVWQLESFRLDWLLMAAAIETRLEREPGADHVLLSFFASTDGFLAQQAAIKLGLPHIVSFQGSDFSRAFFSPYHFPSVRYVVEQAPLIVTNNLEQAEMLSAAFPSAAEFRVIHNAIDIPGRLWTAPRSPVKRLVADCGFSFKKGSHILMRAVADLQRQGVKISLSLAGGDASSEKEYWENYRREMTDSCPGVFSFPGYLKSDELDDLFLSSDLYVSASLGEGCSLSHARAMAMGIPMVATRTGVLPELCSSVSHVRLCAPADVEAFESAVRTMIAGLDEGSTQVDSRQVAGWRTHFSQDRERQEWESVLAESLGKNGLGSGARNNRRGS